MGYDQGSPVPDHIRQYGETRFEMDGSHRAPELDGIRPPAEIDAIKVPLEAGSVHVYEAPAGTTKWGSE